MPLATGTRLGSYEIQAPLGAGGMGEVYRAIDTNLKRAVAIKVLPEALAADAERLARLQREAEVLASLNHPHIAQIYGVEKTEGSMALVLELVEGPTLADRIVEGPIPIEDALPIAKQIMVASYRIEGDSFQRDPPRLWSKTRYLLRGARRSFDLHPDGNRFAMAVAPEVETSVKRDKLVMVFNFFDELRRLVPVKD